MALISRLLIAVALAVLAYIVLAWLIGPLLLMVGIPFVTLVGDFVIRAALILAIVVLLYVLAAGSPIDWTPPWRRP